MLVRMVCWKYPAPGYEATGPDKCVGPRDDDWLDEPLILSDAQVPGTPDYAGHRQWRVPSWTHCLWLTTWE